MTPQDWALRYAAIGWRVYPVVPGTKKASFRNWQADATSDPELIARQWRREPYPNIGLIAGEAFAVFDIEAVHLPALYRYGDALRAVLPETPVAQSGRGGLHIYVRPLPGVATTRKLRIEGLHVGEFKTTGGVIAPPSRTVGQYGWLWWPGDDTLAEAPSWLTALIAEPKPIAEHPATRSRPRDPALALDVLACAVRDEPQGNRNNILFWAACRAADEGIRPDIARAVLLRAALLAGLDEPEACATIESAFRRVAA